MAEAMKNPPRELVEKTCRNCPLFPTKLVNQPPHLVFMQEQVSLLEHKQEIGVRWNESELSARMVVARLAANQARIRSDKKRMKAAKGNGQQRPKPQPSNAPANISNNQAAMSEGQGVWD